MDKQHRIIVAILLFAMPAAASSKNWNDVAGLRTDGTYLWGLADKRGKTIMPAVDYTFIGEFWDGLAVVQDRNGKKGYIDLDGRIVIKPQFDDAGVFSDGVAVVRIGDRFGLVDKTGTVLLKPTFVSLSPSSERLCAAQTLDDFEMEHFGFVDHTGKWVIRNPDFFWDGGTHFFSEGLCAVYLHKHTPTGDVRGYQTKGGYIDKSGKFVIEPRFDWVADFSEGYARVGIGTVRDTKYGFIDKTGKAVCAVEFDEARDFSDGLAYVCKAGKWGAIDGTGKFVIEPRFSDADSFHEGLAGVQFIDSKKFPAYGYIDKAGRVAIKPQFSFAERFSDGLALVQTLKYRYAFINKKGHVVFNVKDPAVQPFTFDRGRFRMAKLVKERYREP